MLNIPQADERDRRTIRKEVPLFNEPAFEEAVINAFVHNRWLDGNAPMFTGFHNRIEILSRGNLPPKQTLEGFYDGVSVPVNEALSRIFIMLHITEHTGRGIPKITDAYGRNAIAIKENTIQVKIPFNRLGAEVYGNDSVTLLNDHTPQDTPQDTPQVYVPEVSSLEQRIIDFCVEAKGRQEIMDYLGLSDRKNLRVHLKRLLDQGRIAMTIPDKPNSKNQKYITIR